MKSMHEIKVVVVDVVEVVVEVVVLVVVVDVVEVVVEVVVLVVVVDVVEVVETASTINALTRV